jgi:tRNA threonylcarbamoyladenosine biosynthesis protein TsaE
MTDEGMIRTADVSETRRAGGLLGALVRAGDVIALSGGLGAGKTALVQGIAAGMGVIGHVPSPTFNILLVHRAAPPLYHFDLYRLDRAEQLVDIDFYETVESDGVAAIEWADRFPLEMPQDHLAVDMEMTDEGLRSMRPEGTGPRSRILARAWLGAWHQGHAGGVR